MVLISDLALQSRRGEKSRATRFRYRTPRRLSGRKSLAPTPGGLTISATRPPTLHHEVPHMRRARWLACLAALGLALPAFAADKPKKVLLVTHSLGFIHDSVG